MIFEKGEVPRNFRKTIVEPLYKKGDKSECGNYRGIRLVSVSIKLISNMMLFRLRNAVDEVIREEQFILEKVENVSTIFSLDLLDLSPVRPLWLYWGFFSSEQMMNVATVVRSL